LKSVLKDLQEF